MRFIFWLVFALSAGLTSLHSNAYFCAPLFGVEGKSFYLSPLAGRNPTEQRMYNESNSLDIGIYDLQGGLIGRMSGAFKPQYKTGFLYFDIPNQAKKQGVSRDFIQLFLRKFPGVEQFSDVLQKDNLTSYNFWFERGHNPEEAVALTPYGRVIISMGFKISEVDVLMNGEVLVKMERALQLVH